MAALRFCRLPDGRTEMHDRRHARPRRLNLTQVHRFGAALATTDGRWALVSASLSLLVAGSVTWMAIGTLPVSGPLVGTPSRTPVAYELFMKLMRAGGGDQFAAFLPQKAPAPTGNEDLGNPSPGEDSRTITLDRGDTLAGALEDQGISAADANAAISAMGKDFNPHALKPGMAIDLTYSVAPSPEVPKPKTTVVMVNRKPVTVPVAEDSDAGAMPTTSQAISRLLSLHFSPAIDRDITITRTTEGGFTADIAKKQLEVHHHRAGATIDSSLYLAGMQAGIPADIVIEMIRMFSYKVDFQRDLHPGDNFEVYYDYYYTPEGQPAKTGDIAYARMRLGGKDVTLYRYQIDPDQPADYFDARGQSAKGMLMKTPVDGARISSGFGARFHPVLGYTRMHKGVDFAVPTGTPVMAAGSGDISFMGWANGYGNFVVLNHGNGYATAYGHLSRFAPGMRKGGRVRQGQVFAYSGATGLATGPHLHYEIRINNSQVNPLTVKIAEGRTLSGSELREFLDQRLKVDATIASLPLETKVADIATDLRQAKVR
jgi:murein DD-endopeptidase MepM/ murein hydrolase activator NlpD